jgi:hypothetical protein
MQDVGADRFADRFDPASYADDPVLGVFESQPDDADALWLSERLFWRLTRVASAYELHTLPLLGGTEPISLNRLQCEGLLDEIAFVAERLNDRLAIEIAQRISAYLAVRTRQPSWDGVVIFEGE